MPANKRASQPFEDYLNEQLQDPEFRAEWEALEPEFALIQQLLDLRHKRGLSQRDLAKRAGMQQSSIARLESGRRVNVRTLLRVAKAMDADVRVVPRNMKRKDRGVAASR